jgi:hypothetical protein
MPRQRHDKPRSLIEIRMTIFTLSGKLDTFRQQNFQIGHEEKQHMNPDKEKRAPQKGRPVHKLTLIGHTRSNQLIRSRAEAKKLRDLQTPVFFHITYLVSRNIKRNFGDAALQILPYGRSRSLQWQRN